MQAPLPFDEIGRLAALRGQKILDTAPEGAFDRIALLAAQFFKVPISLVSLVDQERQWFKARCGMEVSETPRSVSFCAHAILGDDIFVVPDALADMRFSDNALVVGAPYVRFYAGAPLVMPDGHRLGTLCVLDRQPRGFDIEDQTVLRNLAAVIVDELTLRRTLQENRQWSTAIDNLHVGVILVDTDAPELPITFVNEAFESLTHYTAAEIKGRNCRFLQGEGTDPKTVDAIREAVRTKQPFKGELLNYRKDGSPFWNSLTISPIFNEAGDLTAYMGMQVDSTAQYEAGEEIRTRARQAAAVAGLGQQALSGANLDTLFESAMQTVADTFHLELVRLTEWLREEDELLIRAGVGWQPGIVGRYRLPAKAHSLAARALSSSHAFFMEDLRDEPGFEENDIAWSHGAVSGLSVIVAGAEKPFGTLCVLSEVPRRFNKEDLSFVQAVANVLAAAIDRQRAEEALRASQARYQRIADNVPGMVYQSYSDGCGRVSRMTFASVGCREIFGVEPDFLYSHPRFIADCVHSEDKAGLAVSRAEAAAAIQQWQWQGRVVAPGMGERWVQAIARPESMAGGEIRWEGVVTDITARKHSEELARQKVEAERANRAKSEFLSRMSHELRTPLNAILGFGQLLGMGENTPDEDDSIKHILGAGRHLLKLVDEVLDIARIETGRLEFSPEAVPIHELLEKTIGIMRPLAQQYGVTLHPLETDLPDMHVTADRQRLKQVFLNLLSNAVKYNKPGGSVRVDCLPLPSSGRLRVRVADTGMVIPSEMVSRLFTPFDRLGAESSNIEGTGLGLALSKGLVESMGGTIGFESDSTEGTAPSKYFWVDLPTVDSPNDKAAATGVFEKDAWPLNEHLPGGRTLLYIEDNLSNLRLIERLLSKFPQVRLLTAMQGSIGLDLARQQKPDLILLDAHLPDLPGWEVLSRLRAEEGTRAIPVAVISADATERQITRMTAIGAAAYLTKPIDVHQFLQVVRRLLNGTPPQ